MREAEIHDLVYNIGGRNISNACYADDTALIAQSPILEVGQPGNFLPMMLSAPRQPRERV